MNMLSLVLALSSAAPSIVVHSDSAQESCAELAAPFVAVGGLGGMGTGTLIADQWVLTAAHVADFLRLQQKLPITFALDDGRSFTVDRVIIHPDWKPLEEQMKNRAADDLMTPGDIALLHLTEVVEGVEPMALGAFDEANPQVMLVGIGAFANDLPSGATPREVMGMPRGTKHAGTNRVDSVDDERRELIVSFTAPGGEGATAHEASAFAGDSGGPLLARTAHGWTIIGVMGSVDAGNEKLGDYDDVTHATSVGAVRAWIEQSMAE